jgi:hypothetical protein
MRAVDSYARANGERHCSPCVYFSGNLDPAELPVVGESKERCGLGFLPGDTGCIEMRTDNCSARKR